MSGLIIKVVAAFFATMGFAALFGVRPQNLAFTGIVGALGGLAYLLLAPHLAGFAALLFGSVVVGALSEVLARLRRCPATVFSIAGLIPLVPGGRVYNVMEYAIGGAPGSAAMEAYTLLLEAGALALGILLVSSLTALGTKTHHPG